MGSATSRSRAQTGLADDRRHRCLGLAAGQQAGQVDGQHRQAEATRRCRSGGAPRCADLLAQVDGRDVLGQGPFQRRPCAAGCRRDLGQQAGQLGMERIVPQQKRRDPVWHAQRTRQQGPVPVIDADQATGDQRTLWCQPGTSRGADGGQA